MLFKLVFQIRDFCNDRHELLTPTISLKRLWLTPRQRICICKSHRLTPLDIFCLVNLSLANESICLKTKT